jgi:hypothetical protein
MKSEQKELPNETPKAKKQPRFQTHAKKAAGRTRTRDSRATIEISNTPLDFFKDLAHIPSSVVQPTDVYNILARRADKRIHDKVPLRTRLFSAIASPDVFDQLSEACTIIRQKDGFTMPDSLNDTSQTMHALDKLTSPIRLALFFNDSTLHVY